MKSFTDWLNDSPDWAGSDALHIFIFNIGRGLSVFIRTPSNHGILYDLGSSAEFSPLEFLGEHISPHLEEYKNCGIAQLFVSHPHGDHITEIEQVKGKEVDGDVYPYFLTCPHDKSGEGNPEAIDWCRITNRDSESALTDRYKALMDGREPPLQTLPYDEQISIDDLEYGLYYVRPPVVDVDLFPSSDQEYSNGISLVVYIKYGDHTILLPGDVNPDAMELILDEDDGYEKRHTKFNAYDMADNEEWTKENSDQPALKELLGDHGLSVLLAPHHGLESGYSEYLYDAIKDGKPRLVVISEKRHTGENDGTVDPRYQGESGASGLTVNIDGDDSVRKSVSTRNDHHLLIKFDLKETDPVVVLRTDPKELIGEM